MPKTPPPETALTKLGEIHDYHFFAKLASMPNPIEPKTSADRDLLLKIASEVRRRYETEQAQSAQQGNPFLQELYHAITGEKAAAAPVISDELLQKAAAHWASDPNVAKAALDYNGWLLTEQAA